MSFAVDAAETKHEWKKEEALAKNMSLATHPADTDRSSLRRHEKAEESKIVDAL